RVVVGAAERADVAVAEVVRHDEEQVGRSAPLRRAPRARGEPAGQRRERRRAGQALEERAAVDRAGDAVHDVVAYTLLLHILHVAAHEPISARAMNARRTPRPGFKTFPRPRPRPRPGPGAASSAPPARPTRPARRLA